MIFAIWTEQRRDLLACNVIWQRAYAAQRMSKGWSLKRSDESRHRVAVLLSPIIPNLDGGEDDTCRYGERID